jgi:hypothetical protein
MDGLPGISILGVVRMKRAVFMMASNEQLEQIYKQAESAQPVNPEVLKEIRFEMYRRGFKEFHGISFEQLRYNNPYLAFEYQEWKSNNS